MTSTRPIRLLLAALTASLVLTLGATAASARSKVVTPKIQIAILLDTSSSMNGLINQAKTHLWKIVNEFTSAKRGGVRPILEVALYEYGKSTIPAAEGHLRQITPLTTDLDRVSEELFALRTNGGNEHCGQVISSAVHGLQWSTNKRDLKMVFIAGNEAFTQGPVDYRKAVKDAIKRGITVSTIHCGSEAAAINGKWKAGADLADGSFVTIDHNARIARIAAPQDAEINKLGRKLNQTYVGYGRSGVAMAARQAKQDDNASGAGGMAQRSAAKASSYYDNSHWDLVDAVNKGKLDLSKKATLPAKLQKMNLKQRKAYVATLEKERAAIQARIKVLSAARAKYISAARKKSGAKDGGLDAAIRKEVKRKGKKNGFTFKP